MKKCSLHEKDKHPSSLSAIKAALRCSRKRGTPLRVYYDKSCGSWHLTSKTKIDRSVMA